MIPLGLDPHKSAHTATAVGRATNRPIASIRIEAGLPEYRRLPAWATRWRERRWAVEGATGLGRHLAQWLVAAARVSWMSAPPLRPAFTRSTPRPPRALPLRRAMLTRWRPRTTPQFSRCSMSGGSISPGPGYARPTRGAVNEMGTSRQIVDLEL